MSPNISLGLCPHIIAVKVASFIDKSYNFSEGVFINYLTTAPQIPFKFTFWQRWIHIVSTLHVSTNKWIFPYFDTINFTKI